jgi:hypothetical protein
MHYNFEKTCTHTHTYIYIYIYIRTLLNISFLSNTAKNKFFMVNAVIIMATIIMHPLKNYMLKSIRFIIT